MHVAAPRRNGYIAIRRVWEYSSCETARKKRGHPQGSQVNLFVAINCGAVMHQMRKPGVEKAAACKQNVDTGPPRNVIIGNATQHNG